MKTKTKITIIFTMLTGSLLVIVFGIIYFLSERFTKQEFFNQLKERANIIGQAYLEEDEVSAKAYQDIIHKHWQKLPEEEEALIRIDTLTRFFKADSLNKIPPHFFDLIPHRQYDIFINEIITRKSATVYTSEKYYAGILYIDNQGNFMVIASAKNIYGKAKMKNLANILWITYLFGLVFIYLVGRLYAGRILKPISRITSQAKAISSSNLHLRLEHGDNKDELTELSRTFNDMLDRLETDFEIQTNFINNASHELKNPLSAILGETEVALQHDRKRNVYKEILKVIEKEAHRLDILVNNLLKLAKIGSREKGLDLEPLRVDELLFELKRVYDIRQPENKIVLDFSTLPENYELLQVMGSPSLLMVAFNNIIDNACKFSMNKAVIIRITANNNYVIASVKDNGVGISQSELKNITEPFYRAANARSFEGTGIGLPLTQKILRIHNGDLKISSEISKGTEVQIILPVMHKN